MRTLCLLLLSLLALPLSSSRSFSAPQNQPAEAEPYKPVEAYNPARNPYTDMAAALVEARRSHRSVLLEVGGEWCVWCHIMDRFFAEHAELRALRDKNFVTLKINMSPENDNKSFLSQYPRIPGYPHLFVVDANNKLIRSQDTSELEQGNSYNLRRFTQFLEKYAPSAPAK